MDANTMGGPTITAEVVRGLGDALKDHAPPMVPSVKEGRGGKSYRQTRVQVLHHFLGWTPPTDGRTELAAWELPRLTFHPECKNLIRTLPTLPIDPKDSEDVLTTSDDHAYDACTMALMAQIPWVVRDDRYREPHKNLFPGIDPETGHRRPRIWERESQEVQRFRTNVPRYRRGT